MIWSKKDIPWIGGVAALFAVLPLLLLHWKTSGDAVLMSVIGGMRAFFGPLAGAVIFVFLRDIISTYTAHWALPLGAIFVVFVLFFQKGILGIFERGNGR